MVEKVEKAFKNQRELIKDLPIAEEWDDERPIDKFRGGSEYKAQWKCSKGHVWKMAICVRSGAKAGSQCPFCAGNRAWAGFNDLATLRPDLISEWNDEKPPHEVLPGAKYMAKWKCRAYSHEWTAQVSSRGIQNNGCPYCSNRRIITGFNDFATRYPEHVKQWNYEKNTDSPDSFILNYGIRYWWICEFGHEWESDCKDRVNSKEKCPTCYGRTTLNGFNDLASQRPELMKDWDYSKNTLNPIEIAVHTNRKAWWICNDCNHEWEALISNRSRGFGCPECSGAVSKQEKDFFSFIKTLLNGVEVLGNTKEIITPKEIDVYIPSMKLGFEYNGIYWHDKPTYLKDLETGRDPVSREAQKTELCLRKGVTLIHVWSDDWLNNADSVKRDIEELLKAYR